MENQKHRNTFTIKNSFDNRQPIKQKKIKVNKKYLHKFLINPHGGPKIVPVAEHEMPEVQFINQPVAV